MHGVTIKVDYLSGHLCSLITLYPTETVSGFRRTLANHLKEPACWEKVKDIKGGLAPENIILANDTGILFGHHTLAHYFPDFEQLVACNGHLVLTMLLRSGRSAKKMRWLMAHGPVTLLKDNDTGHFRYFVTDMLPRWHMLSKSIDHWDYEMVTRLVTGSPANYHLLPAKFKQCPDIAMVVLAQDGLALARMPASLRANKDVVVVAVTQNRDAYWMASGQLRLHPQVLRSSTLRPARTCSQELPPLTALSVTVRPAQTRSQELPCFTAS